MPPFRAVVTNTGLVPWSGEGGALSYRSPPGPLSGPLDSNLCEGVPLACGPLSTKIWTPGWFSQTQIVQKPLSVRLLDSSFQDLRDQWVIITCCPDWFTQDLRHGKGHCYLAL